MGKLLDFYNNVCSDVSIETEYKCNNGSIQIVQQMYLQVECPKCEHKGWVDNGDVNDHTQLDIECASCPECKHDFFLNDLDEMCWDGKIPYNEDILVILQPKENFPELIK